VTDDTGEEPPLIMMSFVAVAGDLAGRQMSAEIGEGGEFDVMAPGPGIYRIELHLWGLSKGQMQWSLISPEAVTVPEEGDLTGVVIRVGAVGVVQGRVTVPGGSGLRWADVGLVSSRALQAGGSLPLDGGWVFHDAFAHWRKTRDDGSYSVPVAAGSAGLLCVSHRDYAPAWIPIVPPAEGSVTRDVALTPGGSLELRAPDSWLLMAPRPAARLSLPGLPAPILVGLAEVGHEGHGYSLGPASVVFPHLPPGVWTVEVAWGDGTRKMDVLVREGDKTVADLSNPAAP